MQHEPKRPFGVLEAGGIWEWQTQWSNSSGTRISESDPEVIRKVNFENASTIKAAKAEAVPKTYYWDKVFKFILSNYRVLLFFYLVLTTFYFPSLIFWCLEIVQWKDDNAEPPPYTVTV